MDDQSPLPPPVCMTAEQIKAAKREEAKKRIAAKLGDNRDSTPEDGKLIAGPRAAGSKLASFYSYADNTGRDPSRNFRKSKLTRERVEGICAAIRIGCWLEVAAMLNGVVRDTLHDWLKKGRIYQERMEQGYHVEEKDRVYADFLHEVNVSIAEAEIIDLRRIDEAAEKIWQAAAWKLERRYPDRWKNRSTIEHEANKEKSTTPDENLTVEQRKTFLMGVLSSLVGSSAEQEAEQAKPVELLPNPGELAPNPDIEHHPLPELPIPLEQSNGRSK